MGWTQAPRIRACAFIPISDGSWRSEELLERAAWRRRLAQDRLRDLERGRGQEQRRERRRDSWHGPAGHPDHAAAHLVGALVGRCSILIAAIVV